MADDKLLIDPINFEGLAYGVFENAPDAESGRAALLDAYSSYDWTKPEEANKTLEYYGEQLKYKFKDTAEYDAEFLFKNAPVPLNAPEIQPKTEEDYTNLFTTWENANLEYLKTATEPQYVVARKQLADNISKVASNERRASNVGAIRDTFGEGGSIIFDDLVRAGRAGVSLIDPFVEQITGYDLSDRLTELTDPSMDENLGSQVTEGVASGFTIAGTFALNPVAGYAGITAQGADAVKDRYQNTKNETGDTNVAIKAAAVETGSQVLQVVGERLVFGSIGNAAGEVIEEPIKKTAGTFLKETGKNAIGEFGAEGAGQYLSNIAENIQGQKDNITEGATKGVLRAGVIGALASVGVGATAEVATNTQPKIVTQSDNGIRGQELNEFGATLTPTIKQSLGAIHTKNELDDIGAVTFNTELAEEENIDSISQEPVRSKTESLENIEVKAEPKFNTEDGSTYFKTDEGHYVRQDIEGNRENPFDYTVFIDEKTAQKVGKAINEGAQITSTIDGTPVLETVKDGIKMFEEIPHTAEEQEQSRTLEYSQERKPNKDTVVRPARIGKRIRQIIPQGVGAEGAAPYEVKESTFSKKIQDSQTVVGGIKQSVGEGINYRVANKDAIDADVLDIIDSVGFPQLVNDFKNGKFATDPKLQQRVAVGIYNISQNELASASSNGDIESKKQYEELFNSDTAQKVSDVLTLSGQLQALSKGKVEIDGKKISEKFDETYEATIAEIANAEGLDPLELANSANNDAVLDTAIAQTNQEIAIQERAEIAKDESEVESIDDVINQIETDAKANLDEDLASIDKETQDLTVKINSIESKAKKIRDKDITTLEGAVVSDEIELSKAINESINLSDVADEEVSRITSEVQTASKNAETITNKLVKEAITTERNNKVDAKKSALESLDLRIAKAKQSLSDLKTKSSDRLKKLNLQKKDAEKNGDTQRLADVQTKIKQIEDQTIKAIERVRNAEASKLEYLDSLEQAKDAERETEELLTELESGVTISVSPVGKKRLLSVKTKKSGIDVTKLFKKGEAAGPLSALATGINTLADTFSQIQGVKKVSNERITEISNRIKENKKILDAARKRDAVSEADKKRIAQARKRLADLSKARKEATIQSRMSKGDQTKYKKYKDIKANRPGREKSERLKELEDRAKELTRQKEANKKLINKRQLAIDKAATEAKAATERQTKIQQLENLIKTQKLKGQSKSKVENDIATLKLVDEKNPIQRDTLYRMFTANLIGSAFGIALGTTVGVASLITKPLGLIAPNIESIKNFKNINKYKLPLLEFFTGLLDSSVYSRAGKLAWAALAEGKRLENIIPREELIARGAKRSATRQHEQVDDYLKYMLKLAGEKSFISKNPLEPLVKTVYLLSGLGAGTFLRVLAASEAAIYTIHDSTADRASAAFWYNRAIDAKVSDAELLEYQYEPKKNWETAKAQAAYNATQQRNAGLTVSDVDELLNATELYQEMRPRKIQIDAFKQSAGVVLNAPAPGLIGMVSSQIRNIMEDFEVLGTRPLRYLAPFSNSIAQIMQLSIDNTPLGYLGAFNNPTSNRTAFERSISASAATSSIFLSYGMLSFAMSQLDLPEEERVFDIIGNYSSSKGKRDAFTNSGGKLYSLRVGNVYIPFGETPFVLLFGANAAVMDQLRDNKEPDATVWSLTSAAALGAGNALFNISMLKTLTDVTEAIKSGVKGESDASMGVVQSLLVNPVKGLIPSAGLLRNISRYTDNPVEAKKDFKSMLVQGIPLLQGAYGKPSLNVMGEIMPTDSIFNGIHRVFSLKKDDLDIRWLSDNGYSLPPFNRISPRKEMGDIKYNYETRYDIIREASPVIRDIVESYRNAYGSSAYSKAVQKALNTDINRAYAVAAIKIDAGSR